MKSNKQITKLVKIIIILWLHEKASEQIGTKYSIATVEHNGYDKLHRVGRGLKVYRGKN